MAVSRMHCLEIESVQYRVCLPRIELIVAVIPIPVAIRAIHIWFM